jgi:magnesium transporter
LITVRRTPRFDIDEVVRRWDDSPDLAQHGVAFLLYGLLDYVIDEYFTLVQRLDGEADELENLLFADGSHDRELQRRTFDLRRNLIVLRRAVLPMREVVNTLFRRDLALVPTPLAPYYQDVYDHIVRVSEWTESLRDLIASVSETHLTIQGNRLNLIMKKVTGWGAIIAVPTAITGFFGQNVPYPGSQEPAGFYASTALQIVLCLLLYRTFRRRDWL